MKGLIFIVVAGIATSTNADIKIEYDTKSEKIKILSKSNNKECLKQLSESKNLIKTASKDQKGRVKMTFKCIK